MNDALMIYFDGEKYAGLFLTGVGLAGIMAAAVLLRASSGLRSFAITLIVLAVAEIALGVGLYLRTGPQVNRLVAQLGSDAPRLYSDEGTRMARVQRNFVVVEYIELSIIILTAIIAVTLKARHGLTGIALALLINAAFLLAFDLVAERRGAAYLSAIERSRPAA
jgi:hypothetical protein